MKNIISFFNHINAFIWNLTVYHSYPGEFLGGMPAGRSPAREDTQLVGVPWEGPYGILSLSDWNCRYLDKRHLQMDPVFYGSKLNWKFHTDLINL